MMLFKNFYRDLKLFTINCDSNTHHVNAVDVPNQMTAAQKLIRKSPTLAIGYLVSGQIYIRQSNPWAALDIFKKGLSDASPMDAMYPQLEKEVHDVSVTIHRLSQRMAQVPDEILYLIFEFVTPQDLLRCSGVCRAWCALLMDWSVFWKKLSIELPYMRRLTLDPLIRRQVQTFRLDGPMNDWMVKDALHLLEHFQDAHYIKKLHFSRLSFCSDYLTATLLPRAIKSMSPPLKQVVFVDCWFTYDLVFQQLLPLCCNLTHVSFTRCHVEPWINILPTKKQRIRSLALTYLKLSLDWFPPGDQYAVLDQLSGLLHHCPNLITLLLNSKEAAVYPGDIVNCALKSCSRLRTLAWNPKADIATSIIEKSTDTAHKGLRNLILRCDQDHPMAGYINIYTIIKKVHLTLEVLDLFGFADESGPDELLRLLSRYDFPELHEIHIPTAFTHCQYVREYTIPSKLFLRCPNLEAITILDKELLAVVENDLLRAIAQGCPMLRYLQIISQQSYTDEGILEFAAIGGSRLTYLEITVTDDNNLLEIVNRLPMLQYLHIHGPISDIQDIDPNIKSVVNDALRKRKESLIIV